MPLTQLLNLSSVDLQSELQLILNAVVEGLCGVDIDGNMTFCNDALLRMTGHQSEGLIGKSLHLTLHYKRFDGTFYPEEECPLRKAISARQAFHAVSDFLWRQDGTGFPAKYWAHPLRHALGSTVSVITVQDMTERERAIETLRTSEEKFRRILMSVADVAWTSDRDGRTLYISPKVQEVLGYTKQEISAAGSTLRLSLIHPGDFGRVNKSYLALFDKQAAFDEEYRIRHKDGKWIWIQDHATGTHEEKGVLYADGVFTDISARKEGEAELQSKTAFLEGLANSTIDGILVVGNGRRLLHNRRFVDMFGVPAALLAESEDGPMLDYTASVVKDREGFLARVQHLNRHPNQTSRDEIELSDGRFFDCYSAGVVDKNSTYHGRIWTFRDITERKQDERMLRLTIHSLEVASDAVLWADPNARIVYANQSACRNLERSREELLSLSIPDIAPPFSMEEWTAHWQQLKTAGVVSLDVSQTSKSGRVFPVEVTANYLEFDGQEYSFAFVRDVTERRELEGQLRHAQKLEGIGQLAAGIAHEINTPTQFVTDNLTFLRDSWKSTDQLLRAYRAAIQSSTALPPDLLAHLESVEKSCDLDFVMSEVPRAIDQSLDGAHRIAEIVRAMKEFSHPDSLEKTAADLNKGVASTITVARNEWRFVADVSTRFDETLPRVSCYPSDVNQVVLNLIVNAAHAIKDKMKDGEKGKITVCTRLRGDLAEISVSDTGTGIPEKIRTRIFDPFFTTKEVGKGTGQGLSLAHAVVVKKHGGKIWFETEMGLGTTFFIHLPIKPLDRGKDS